MNTSISIINHEADDDGDDDGAPSLSLGADARDTLIVVDVIEPLRPGILFRQTD